MIEPFCNFHLCFRSLISVHQSTSKLVQYYRYAFAFVNSQAAPERMVDSILACDNRGRAEQQTAKM